MRGAGVAGRSVPRWRDEAGPIPYLAEGLIFATLHML
jgi:hypothetical protein